jgi:N-acetylneuraminic acid mutarotase
MKIFLSSIIFFCCAITVSSQNYTWMRGQPLNGTIAAVYGTQGTASASNEPGTRHGCATWTDASGNLWMFGGEGISGTPVLSWLNDLWKYDISLNQWIWIRGSNAPDQVGNYGTPGVPASTNEPGAREFAVSWVDASGNFWLFGGDGFASTSTFGRLADLWKYNPATNQWTFMKGYTTVDQYGAYGTVGTPSSTNMPGSRYAPAPFKDASGNLWMFGGRGFASAGTPGFLNDLWRYNIATNTWTWMKGSSLADPFTNYGTLNVSAPSNNPGGRDFSSYWENSSGEFILFGGRGYAVSSSGYLNDMWKFNVSSNNWTWINGTNSAAPQGIYGPAGVPSSTTMPGGRMSAASWKDQSGNLYIFGGLGWSSVNLSRLNDLFKYNPSTNEWTFLKGSTLPNQNGTYGTMGVPAPTNVPGARQFNTWWTSPAGVFWLFGGEGKDSTVTGSSDNMNDLWKYTPPCNPDSIGTNQGVSLCSGNSVTLTAFNQYPSTVSWYMTPSAGTPVGNGSVFATPPLIAVASQSVYTYYAEANSCTNTPRAMISVSVNPSPLVAINGPSVACEGSIFTMTATGASSYTWNTGSTSSTATFIAVPPSTTAIVIGKDAVGCENNMSATITTIPSPTVTVTSNFQVICSGNSATLTAIGANSYSWSNSTTGSSVVVSPSVTTTFTVTGTATNNCTDADVITLSVSPCMNIESYNDDVSLLSVFPNPSSGEINIHCVETGFLIITNMIGQAVLETEINSRYTSLNTKLAAGIYLCSLNSPNGKTSTVRLIILN